MNKKTIITILLALVTMTGQGQVRQHGTSRFHGDALPLRLFGNCRFHTGRKWRNHITQRYIAKCEEMCTYQQKQGNSCQTSVH